MDANVWRWRNNVPSPVTLIEKRQFDSMQRQIQNEIALTQCRITIPFAKSIASILQLI
jgi:hypothetical protein